MKWLRWGIWTLLMGVLLLFWAENAVSKRACDKWLEADTRIRLLKVAHEQLMAREPEVRREMEAAQDRVEAHRAVFDQLQDDIIQKEKDVNAKEGDLAATKRELAQHGTSPRERKAKAKQTLKAAKAELAKIDKLDERLRADRRVSGLREELKKVRQAYAKKSGGQSPDDLLGWIDELGYCGPVGTDIYSCCATRGRREGYQDSSRTIPGTDAEILAKEKVMRAELKRLAQRMQTLPGELKKAESNLLTDEEKDLLSQRSQLEASVARAEQALVQAGNADGLSKRYADRLRERVKEKEQELAVLKRELSELKRKLEGEKTVRQEAKAAEESFKRLEPELVIVEKDLEELKGNKKIWQKEIEAMAQRLSVMADYGLAEGRVALHYSREGNADDCQEALNKALDALKEASGLAAENRSCLDSAVLERINKVLQKAEAIDCGTGPQVTLIEVPMIRHGMTLAEAKVLLTGAGFTNIFDYEYLAPKKKEDEGKVIGVSPPPGQRVSPQTKIMISTYNKKWVDLVKADEELDRAKADGGAWDAAANNASVSTQTHTPVAPTVPTSSPPSPPTTSQVDRANAVAQQATAQGPQAEPFITPRVMGTISQVAGMATSTMTGSGRTTEPIQTTPGSVVRVGSNPLPGVIPSTGSTSGSTAASNGGSTSTPRSGNADCPIWYSGAQGDTYYVIDPGGNPPAFEIRLVYDPPRGDANRQIWGTHRGAMKKSIEQSLRQLGRPARQVLGPYNNRNKAQDVAKGLCRR